VRDLLGAAGEQEEISQSWVILRCPREFLLVACCSQEVSGRLEKEIDRNMRANEARARCFGVVADRLWKFYVHYGHDDQYPGEAQKDYQWLYSERSNIDLVFAGDKEILGAVDDAIVAYRKDTSGKGPDRQKVSADIGYTHDRVLKVKAKYIDKNGAPVPDDLQQPGK
jgi:hypothetical protein